MSEQREAGSGRLASAVDAIVYPRPDERFIHERRINVDRRCPECGGTDVQEYKAVLWMGPRIVVQCQDCLNRLDVRQPGIEDQWPPFASVTRAGAWAVSRAG